MQCENKAHALFCEGFNCAQSVFGAFSEITKIDPKLSLKIAAPFGGGLGRSREVCGAISGMLMALGAIYGYDEIKAGLDARAEHYAQVRALLKGFMAEHTHLRCRDLLAAQQKCGLCADAHERQNDPCSAYVGTAARLLTRFIEQNPPAK